MKKYYLLGLILLICKTTFSQEQPQTEVDVKTKFTEFTARAGKIMSYEDYNQVKYSSMPYGTLTMKKRIVKSGSEEMVFYILEKPLQYSRVRTAAIASNDMKDLLNAINTLINDANIDKDTKSDYMEKYYTTEDYFKFGYFVKGGEVNWYVDLNTRLSESVFFINDINKFLEKLKSIIN